MENVNKLYDICRPSWARATPPKDGWGKLEPAEDDAPSAYVVRVSAEYDNCQHGYIDARNEAEIWAECELIGPFGCMRLKTRKTWHGEEAAWSGDYVGRIDEHPELERLCDRAQEAVERYLYDKLEPYLKVPIDAVVLGCTHYPFLSGAIRKVVGRRPAIMDGSAGIAMQLRRKLAERGLLAPDAQTGSVRFENSLDEPEILELSQALFDYQDATP